MRRGEIPAKSCQIYHFAHATAAATLQSPQIGMALFGEQAWLARGEAFSVFFALIARVAPLQVRDGRLILVVPGQALASINLMLSQAAKAVLPLTEPSLGPDAVAVAVSKALAALPGTAGPARAQRGGRPSDQRSEPA